MVPRGWGAGHGVMLVTGENTPAVQDEQFWELMNSTAKLITLSEILKIIEKVDRP